MQSPATKKKFDVLGTGAVAVDDLLYVNHFPRPEEKLRVHRRERQCGGQTGTALVTVARLGRRAGYIGMLGDYKTNSDDLSQTVVETFAREGVDLAHHVPRSDSSVFHSTIIVDESKNSRTILTQNQGLAGADPLLPGEDVIRSTAVLLVDHHSPDGTIRAARIARAADIAVVGDIERASPNPGGRTKLAELMPLIDHLVVPLRFAREWTGIEDAAEATAKLWQEGIDTQANRSAVVVTCGKAGCWYIGNDVIQAVQCPAFEVEVTDTTGCGDVFHGAYCVALGEGMSLPDRIKFASAASALKATRHGGQAGIPTRKQLEAFLVEHP